MEAGAFFIIVLVVVIIIFADGMIRQRKAKEAFISKLKQNYGKPNEKVIDTKDFENISDYHNGIAVSKECSNFTVDEITWNDFSMDDVFRKIDFCMSSIGEEQLYHMLHCPNIEKNDNETHFKEMKDYFVANEEKRIAMQYILHEIGISRKISLTKIMDYLYGLQIKSNVAHFLVDFAVIASIIFIFINPGFGVLTFMLVMMVSIYTYLNSKKEVDPFITTFVYINKMINAVHKIDDLKIPVLSEEMNEAKNAVAKLKGVRKGMFWISTGAVTMDNPIMLFVEYMKLIFHIDLIKFNSMVRIMKNSSEEIKVLRRCLGVIDAAIAVGAFESSLEICSEPEFVESAEPFIDIKDAIHLLVKTHEPVPNSINTSRPILITGSNASGKSTFLKTVGITALLAETIGIVPARHYRATRFAIYSSMALNDSIKNGESYFVVEIKSLKRIVDAAKGEVPVLCFIDEVLRGTNTVERVAASSNILKVIGKQNAIPFAATHDIELTKLLEEAYINYHFEEEIMEEDVKFDFLLKEGKAISRNAIKLLQLMDYDEEVISESERLVDKFLTTGAWE